MTGPEARTRVLVARAEAVDADPATVRACLDELLRTSADAGVAVALGLLSREPRSKPSRGLLIDPHDGALRRWQQRVAAALVASGRVSDEVGDELADSPDLARDVRDSGGDPWRNWRNSGPVRHNE